MVPYRIYPIIIGWLLVLLSTGNAQESTLVPLDTVARIGPVVITARELLQRLELMPFPVQRTRANTDSIKLQTLYAMIAEKILAHTAYSLGLSEDKQTTLMRRELENLFVRDELYKREILSRARPTREEITEGMARITKELQVLSFLVYSEQAGEQLIRELRRCRPDSVLQKIVRSSYTQADTLVIRFGAPDTAFERAAFAIDRSRVSKIFSSNNFGWTVLYLLDQRTNKSAAALNLADRQRRVEKIIQARHEEELMSTYTFEVLKSRNAIADSVLFHALADSISSLWREDTSRFKSKGRFILTSDLVDVISARMKPWSGFTMITMDDGTISLAELLEMFRYLDFTAGMFEGDLFKQELNAVIKDQVAREILAHEGRRQGLQNSRSVRGDLQLWTDYWAARSLYYRIQDTVSVSEDEIIRYFLKNINVFGRSYQVNVREVLCADRSDVVRILDELQQGTSLTLLAKQYSKRTAWAEKGGESGYFIIADHPEIGFSALMADTSRIVGPLRLPEGYSLFTVLGKRTTKQALSSFDTLKTNVHQRLLGEKRNQSLNRFVAEQAQRQQVTIDRNKVQRIPYSQVPMFTRRFIGFGGRMTAAPLLMKMWDWMKEIQKPPALVP